MALTIDTVPQDFTPAEAAGIAGVSVAQQRDWRRRGILSERESSGWTRFKSEGLIDLATLGFFTRMGFNPSVLSTVRHMAVLPTLAGIAANPAGYAFTGAELAPARRQGVLDLSVGGASSHILVITGDDVESPAPIRVSSYEAVQEVLRETGSPTCLILDCYKLADHLIEKAGRPLFKVEVSNA